MPSIKQSNFGTESDKSSRYFPLQVKVPKQKALAGKGPSGATKVPEQRSGVIRGPVGSWTEGPEPGASETSTEATVKVQATGGAEGSVGARDAGRAGRCGSQPLGTQGWEEEAQRGRGWGGEDI